MRAGNYTRSIKPNTIRSPPTHSPLPKTALIEQPEGQAAHYRRESLVHHRNERGEDGSGQQRSHPLPPTRRAAHQHGQQGLQEYSCEVFRPSQPVPAIFRSNGITYKQEARISKTFEHDRQLRFHPEIGFLFKEKELRLRLTTDWEYHPGASRHPSTSR